MKSLSRSALVLPLKDVFKLARPLPNLFAQTQVAAKPNDSIGATFVDVGREAGLNVETIYGGVHKNKYLLETTGCGVAFYDYDNDGWLDIFLVNGWRLEGFPAGHEPTTHL
ncbi:MAG TPA: CRTAC1 family protein, partial [Terriglobales bacterium]